jgi:hypothetical protein
VRDGFPAFLTESAKAIFWDRFTHYTALHGYVPWVTTLLDNHYHTLGYLRAGNELGEMMRKLHGSVAWLVMKETKPATCPSGAAVAPATISTVASAAPPRPGARIDTLCYKPFGPESYNSGKPIHIPE